MTKLFFLLICGVVFYSCKNDYKVSVTNYYIEPLDSVIVGKKVLVFEKVQRQASTEYKALQNGNYTILVISKNKTMLSSTITIPVKGKGNRTIQIDGLGRISILDN